MANQILNRQLVKWTLYLLTLLGCYTSAVADETLTAIGAIKDGNANGAIPEWAGGLGGQVQPNAQLRRTAGRFADPYANDTPILRITPSNYQTHADKLSAGHIKMLQTYPSYFLEVYPTRRSAAYPQAIYDAALANDGKAQLDGDTLTNAKLSVPFRQPTTGQHVIMNHRLRYRGDTFTRFSSDIIVNSNGQHLKTSKIEKALFNFGNIRQNNPAGDEQFSFYYVSKVTAPPKDAGSVLLMHEYLQPVSGDKQGKTNNAWFYTGMSTKARNRAPNIAYDYRLLGGDGQIFADQFDMFTGAMNLYRWQLKGREEFYIPYNSYQLADKSLTYAEILPGNHINQTLARYELHRTWVVEAELTANSGHSIGRRTFYVDEDSWSIVMVDVYDRKGGLWRFQEGHAMQFYGMGDVMFTSTAPEIIYDFQNGKYFASVISNEETTISFDNPNFEKKMFQANYIKKI